MSFLKVSIGSLWVRAGGFLLVLALLFSVCASAQSSAEYHLKSVFLFNFTHFIEWPDHSLGQPTAPFVIGVYGPNDFGSSLEETVKGERVQGHPIVVRHYEKAEDIKTCHILFVHRSMKDLGVLSSLKKETLTVGDASSFTSEGGMIRFYTENNKIRLAINKRTLDGSGLKVSSKLLRLATVSER